MMGPITDEEKKQEILINNLYLKYQNEEDRDSAYEFFQRMTKEAEIQAAEEAEAKEAAKIQEIEAKKRQKEEAALEKKRQKEEKYELDLGSRKAIKKEENFICFQEEK